MNKNKAKFQEAMSQLEQAFKQGKKIVNTDNTDLEKKHPKIATENDINFKKAISKLEQLKEKNDSNQTITPIVTEPTKKKIQFAEDNYPDSELKTADKFSKIEEQNFNPNLNIKHKLYKKEKFLKEKFLQFGDLKMDLFVKLGETKILLNNLKNIEEGDVIETKISIDNSLDLYLNQQNIGKAKLNRDKFNFNLEIERFF